MNSEELKKLREEFDNLKSTPSILDIDESTLNEFRLKGDGNIFQRFMDAVNRDKIVPSNEKINKDKEINNKENKNNSIEKEIDKNEKKNNLNNKNNSIEKEIDKNEKKNNLNNKNSNTEKEINNNKEIINKDNVNKDNVNKDNVNTVKDKSPIDFKTIEKYSSSPKDVTMKDFESPPPKPKEVKPVISPATFKTNQKQTRELVSTGKLKDTDLNKYSRSNTYTADDGTTQVNRSTVNTIAKFDMGPNIKKGEKIGVISGNLRKRYDLKAANFKAEAYDVVLDYVLSEGHADSVEEAHYVMMQLDEETIKEFMKKAALIGAGGVLAYKGLKKAGDSFNNLLNDLRNNSNLGGNKRVDDVRKNSGDPNVGQKYKFGNQGNKP